MARDLYLIAYDVCDHRRLAKVHHFLKGYSTGGQKSVYECFLTPTEVVQVERTLRALIDDCEDRIYVLGMDGRSRTHTLGIAVQPKDPVNALLSLGYTLLHCEMLRELQLIGLDPMLGFLHQFAYGRESLACDLVEPQRPAVDRWVWELFRERMFTERDFTTGDERPGCYMKKESRRRYYELYEAWAESQRSLWTDEIRALARRINDGQDPVPEGEQGPQGEEGRPLALDT